jgi:hypothetical protein
MRSLGDQDLVDGRGCLTEAGLAAVLAAAPGAAPQGLAAHVRECQRCQYRLLSGREPGGRGVPKRRELWQRLWAVVVVAALAAASLVYLGWWLTRAG